MKLFDSHAHLDDEAYDSDRERIIAECEAELAGVLNPGCDLLSSAVAVDLAERYRAVYAAVGFHPHEARLMQPGDEAKLAAWCQQPKVVAIGEIGLDYYYDHSPRAVQKEVFIRQLDLARQLDLPVIIHNRDAHGDILEIIKKEGKGLRGVFHCYSGSWETARELLKLGWYLAFGGSLTFKNAVKTVEVARNTPLERILLETDSPYLSPAPLRGKRNKPTLVKLVCEKMAVEKSIPAEEIARATTANVCDLFSKIRIKDEI